MANNTSLPFIIDIVKDFSSMAGGRYPIHSDFSGQKFRDEILVPALNKYARVKVILDGAEGLDTSFLDESFGGLIRNGLFSRVELEEKLVIISNMSSSARRAWNYIETANVQK